MTSASPASPPICSSSTWNRTARACCAMETPSPRATGPFVFGEPGTNSQHAFFQLLHQGTEVAPVDFLVAAEPTHADEGHHALLFANCLAQSEALLRGRSRRGGARHLARAGPERGPQSTNWRRTRFSPATGPPRRCSTASSIRARSAASSRSTSTRCSCSRSSGTSIPFDQWGVELGKELCSRLAPLVSDASADLSGLDGSTAGLIAARRALQGELIIRLRRSDWRRGRRWRPSLPAPAGRWPNRDRAADACAKRQDSHDRLAADRFATTRHRDLGVELLGAMNEFRRSAGVQALAVDDLQFARDGAFGRWGLGGQSLGPASSK